MSGSARSGKDTIGEEDLARLHLRTGALLLAQAELEALSARAALSAPGLAGLAEARWRTGNLEFAAEAAADHLASGGTDPIASVILAEAAAAAGRPDDVVAHMAALGTISQPSLIELFAGMPHRADWSMLAAVAPVDAVSAVAVSADDAPAEDDGPIGDRRAAPIDPEKGEVPPGAATATPATRRTTAPAFPEPEDLLATARDDLRSGESDRVGQGIDRLGLAFRLHVGLAPQVVDLLARRPEPAALLVRGDALRSLGRILDAEASYAKAAAALERTSRRRT